MAAIVSGTPLGCGVFFRSRVVHVLPINKPRSQIAAGSAPAGFVRVRGASKKPSKSTTATKTFMTRPAGGREPHHLSANQ
jgi:hypothetical protein